MENHTEKNDNLELDFYPVHLISHALPTARTDATVWERTNGVGKLTMTATPFTDETGETRTILPSGKLARLALLWLSTEAKKHACPRVDLAASYRRFLADLGLPWNHQTAHAAVEQLRAILAMTLTWRASETLPDGATAHKSWNMLIGRRAVFTFDEQANFDETRSHLLLSDDFYELIIRSHVAPIDATAWAKLIQSTSSPLALDVYLWLSTRLPQVTSPVRITWETLQAQFGTDISRMDNFKIKFRKALVTAQKFYPAARVEEAGGGRGRRGGFRGIILHPSPPAVPPAPNTNDDEDD